MERQASQPNITAAPEPTQQLDRLLASVSSDMEALFARAPGAGDLQGGGGRPTRPKVVTFVSGGDRPRRNFIAPLALALAGGALGLFALSASPPGETPLPSMPSTAMAPALPGVAVPPPAPALAEPPTSAAPPVIIPGPSLAARPPRGIKASSGKPDAAPTRKAAAPSRERARGAAGSYATLMQADRRLRRAYANAIRAGVDRRALVGYRDRWARARREAAHNPRWALSDYRGLERDLYDKVHDIRTIADDR